MADLLGSQYLFEILQTSFTVKNSENVVKSGCFGERLEWRLPNFFRSEGGRYLFEILHTLSTVKTSINVVKS